MALDRRQKSVARSVATNLRVLMPAASEPRAVFTQELASGASGGAMTAAGMKTER
jgi:hypothetical protein